MTAHLENGNLHNKQWIQKVPRNISHVLLGILFSSQEFTVYIAVKTLTLVRSSENKLIFWRTSWFFSNLPGWASEKLSCYIRPQFFYLLDYISLSGFSKCGDRKKNKNKNWTSVQNVPLFICPSQLHFYCQHVMKFDIIFWHKISINALISSLHWTFW